MTIIPRRATDGENWGMVLALIRDAFADMAQRIDPPSSMHALTEALIERQAGTGEVWLIGAPPVACMFLTPKPGVLYIGKLAVAGSARRQGHARRLLAVAERRARSLGLAALELETRVELTENHATFAALGFRQTAATAHPGFARATSLTFTRILGPAGQGTGQISPADGPLPSTA